MRIEEWITKLKNDCLVLQGRVFGAAEMAVAKTNSMQTPCVFIIPMAESAKGNTLAGGHSQEITAQVGVYIAVTNKSDARGEAAHAMLESVRDEIKKVLCAWQPTNADFPVDFVAGQLIGYDNYTMRWSDVFTTQLYYRKVL